MRICEVTTLSRMQMSVLIFFLTEKNHSFKEFGGEFSETPLTDRKTPQNRSETTKNTKKMIFVKIKISKKIPPAASQLFPIFFLSLPTRAKSDP